MRIIPRIFVETFNYPPHLVGPDLGGLPAAHEGDVLVLGGGPQVLEQRLQVGVEIIPPQGEVFTHLRCCGLLLSIFYFHDLCCFTKSANFHPLVISYPTRFAFFYLMYLMTFLFL